jgi:hypothetical protein
MTTQFSLLCNQKVLRVSTDKCIKQSPYLIILLLTVSSQLYHLITNTELHIEYLFA